MSAQFTFIDLCAGIGGLRIPFDSEKSLEMLGKCVFTAEIDQHAKITYATYFKQPSQTLEEAVLEISNDLNEISPLDVPAHDLLLAGFPCQPFSHAGKRQGFSDERGGIFERISKIIEVRTPKVILLENVRGLKTLRNEDGSSVLGEILKDLEETKNGVRYFVPTPKLLNARDFGLAQNRVRLFIVAIREDVALENGLLKADDFIWPSATADRDSLLVSDFLDKNPPKEFTISDRLWKGHLDRKARNAERGKGWGYQKFSPDDKYVATISARYFKDGSEALIEQKGSNPRKLTPNEARRLQGFPEDFPINASKMQAFRQFGNAVPVNVIAALAESLKKYLT